MRNLFLVSVFGLFMLIGLSSQSLAGLTLVPSAAASGSDNDDNDETSTSSNDDNDETSTSSNDDNDETSTSSNDDSASVALNCPDGITTCYSADGIEYTDVNNLDATAAGSEGEDDDGQTIVSVVKPSHYRSF